MLADVQRAIPEPPIETCRRDMLPMDNNAIKDLRGAIREILWRNPLERGLPGEREPVRHFADVAAATGARLA